MKLRVKRLFRRFGYDVSRYDLTKPNVGFATLLRLHKIDLVLDIGANEGSFIKDLRTDCGYQGRAVSFEPLSNPHHRLLKAASGDPLWTIAPRCAIGDEDGETTINVAGNSVSSSLLPMLSTHLDAAPK